MKTRSLSLRVLGRPTGALPDHWRPRTRGDCVDMPRPCPYVGCKYHLALDVMPNGTLRLDARGADAPGVHAATEAIAATLRVMPETCALDVADAGGATFDRLGEILGVVRERARQIEREAVAQIAASGELAEHAEEPPG